MTALMASSLVGREGRGFAFEPNPEAFARLKRHFQLDRTANLEPVPFAPLGPRGRDEPRLTEPQQRSWVAEAVNHEGLGRSFKVRTVTGRPYLKRLDPAKPTIIKIDVEGHEVKTLAGIEDVLDWPEVAILSEVNDFMLRRAGDSAEALFELLTKHGFRPLVFDLRRSRFQTKFTITAGSWQGRSERIRTISCLRKRTRSFAANGSRPCSPRGHESLPTDGASLRFFRQRIASGWANSSRQHHRFAWCQS